MIAQRQGSTRLPLDPSPKGPLRTLVGDILRVAGLGGELARISKRIAALTAAPSFNSVIGTGDARLPLVVDDGCLYSERARTLEVRVAERIAARLREPAIATRAVPPSPASTTLTDEQQRAAAIALARLRSRS